MEDVLLHEPGFQPFLEDGLAHRDVIHQPFVADPVEARLDVSLEDPTGTAPVAQDDVALVDGIGRRSFLPKPIGVGVGRRLRDGIESLQVECLHRPIFHRGNPERTHLAVILRYVHTPQRLGIVAPLLERLQSRRFLLRGVPGLLVHTRGPFALVFRHSSDGKGLAAERMSQQILQGFHLAPSAGLNRLHDTRLEPTHDAVGGLPVDGVPAFLRVGGRTSRANVRRHLLAP